MSKSLSGLVQALGHALPTAAVPVANYVPFVVAGPLVFLSGQIAQRDGKRPYIGKVGDTVSLEDAVKAAELCALNLLSWMAHVVNDDADRIVRCVKLGAFVNSAPSFMEQPKVVNGASDLLVAVLGDKGRHARSAVGTNVLPFDVAVEIDAVFEIVT